MVISVTQQRGSCTFYNYQLIILSDRLVDKYISWVPVQKNVLEYEYDYSNSIVVVEYSSMSTSTPTL